jgi:hypothetical protein
MMGHLGKLCVFRLPGFINAVCCRPLGGAQANAVKLQIVKKDKEHFIDSLLLDML